MSMIYIKWLCFNITFWYFFFLRCNFNIICWCSKIIGCYFDLFYFIAPAYKDKVSACKVEVSSYNEDHLHQAVGAFH